MTQDESTSLDRRRVLAASGAASRRPLASTYAATLPGATRHMGAYTHFMPIKYLDFAEKDEGELYPLPPLLEHILSSVDAKARLNLFDRNQV